MEKNNKTYLGDGVYLQVLGAYDIILTCEDGIKAYETIVLDRNMIDKMNQAIKEKLDVEL